MNESYHKYLKSIPYTGVGPLNISTCSWQSMFITVRTKYLSWGFTVTLMMFQLHWILPAKMRKVDTRWCYSLWAIYSSSSKIYCSGTPICWETMLSIILRLEPYLLSSYFRIIYKRNLQNSLLSLWPDVSTYSWQYSLFLVAPILHTVSTSRKCRVGVISITIHNFWWQFWVDSTYTLLNKNDLLFFTLSLLSWLANLIERIINKCLRVTFIIFQTKWVQSLPRLHPFFVKLNNLWLFIVFLI